MDSRCSRVSAVRPRQQAVDASTAQSNTVRAVSEAHNVCSSAAGSPCVRKHDRFRAASAGSCPRHVRVLSGRRKGAAELGWPASKAAHMCRHIS